MLKISRTQVIDQKFVFQYVAFEGECWIWQGYVDFNGYGRCRNKFMHRVSFELHKGTIPIGYSVHHTCRRKSCINPAHLQAISREWHSKLHCDKYANEFRQAIQLKQHRAVEQPENYVVGLA